MYRTAAEIEETKKRIIELYNKGLSSSIISQRVGLTTNRIGCIISKHKRKLEDEKTKGCVPQGQ